MRLVLVSGSWPPDGCGVGDYSDRLAAGLLGRGIDALRFGSSLTLRTQDSQRAAREIRAHRPDVVHIQYPTAGYGRSLCPSLLPMLLDCPTVVTLHEYSIFRGYRWPWFAGFAYGSDAVIFTSEAERAGFARRMPAMRARTEVIPIGSNIPEGPDLPRDPRSVCYFGLLAPRKGIEMFLALARKLASSTPPIQFSLIGSVPATAESYANHVLHEAGQLGINCHVGLTAEEVARQLKGITYAYLPFPGQVTERRGSLLAALINGIVVLAPHGPLTPAWLRNVVVDASSPDVAAERLSEMMGGIRPINSVGTLSDRLSWPNIAAEHVALYHSVLRRRDHGPGSQVLQIPMARIKGATSGGGDVGQAASDDASTPLAHDSNRPDAPAVTIIIPTLNRPQYALDTVGQVLDQSFRNFELLVVDQSSRSAADDLQTRLALLNDPRVRYVHLSVPGVANARNEGVARRRGRIILFLDDDVILLGEDFIASHLHALADPQVGGATGRIVERLNRPNARRTIARVSIGGRTLDNMSGIEAVPIEGLKGGNMSLKAIIFDQIGGFDRNFGGTGLLEEADFSTRIRAAGWKLIFEPRAELFHFSAPVGGNRVESDLQREWWRFRATAYYIRKHRGILGLPPFLLTFALIGLRCAWRERAPSALAYLASGIRAGLLAYRNGPDEQLPCRSAEECVHEQPALRA